MWEGGRRGTRGDVCRRSTQIRSRRTRSFRPVSPVSTESHVGLLPAERSSPSHARHRLIRAKVLLLELLLCVRPPVSSPPQRRILPSWRGRRGLVSARRSPRRDERPHRSCFTLVVVRSRTRRSSVPWIERRSRSSNSSRRELPRRLDGVGKTAWTRAASGTAGRGEGAVVPRKRVAHCGIEGRVVELLLVRPLGVLGVLGREGGLDQGRGDRVLMWLARRELRGRGHGGRGGTRPPDRVRVHLVSKAARPSTHRLPHPETCLDLTRVEILLLLGTQQRLVRPSSTSRVHRLARVSHIWVAPHRLKRPRYRERTQLRLLSSWILVRLKRRTTERVRGVVREDGRRRETRGRGRVMGRGV